MKYIPLILTLIFTLPLASQMEFERVWQIHPDDGIAQGTRLYYKKDTILLMTESAHSGDIEINYFYTTDDGNNWNDLREEINISAVITEKYDFLGNLHPLTFEFYKLILENDTTSYIYIMNLQGVIQKKISYPYLPTQSGIKLNPIDPNYISVHRQRDRMFPLEYNHDVGYSTDRGDTWDYMRPEEELKKQRGILLPTLRKIDYYFSPKNKGKILYEFLWDNGWGEWYRLVTEYNYIEKKYNFSTVGFNLDKFICYECFETSNLTFINNEDNVFESYNINTLEKTNMYFEDRLPFLNSDSLNNEEKQIDITGFWGDGLGFLKSNLINDLHKVLYISIRSDYISEHTNQIDYNNQLFFQSFDNGETWEFLFNNDDLHNQVVGMFINHINNDLWILKDSTVSNRIAPSSDSPVLYKSLQPLTSVEHKIEQKFKVIYNNNRVIINSDEYYSNINLRVYSVTGKLLFDKNIDLQIGENRIETYNQLDEKLLLIQLNTNISQIFKLIRSD